RGHILAADFDPADPRAEVAEEVRVSEENAPQARHRGDGVDLASCQHVADFARVETLRQVEGAARARDHPRAAETKGISDRYADIFTDAAIHAHHGNQTIFHIHESATA